MIVCLCNDLNSADIERAIEKGGKSSYEEILSFNGCQPCCGICEHSVADIIEDAYSKPLRRPNC